MYEVVIAGAGPVGLFLAGEIARQGSRVVVLEQAREPESPLKRLPFGMRGLWGPSVEAFYRRGLLDSIAANAAAGGPGQPSAPGGKRSGPAGHFAGIQFEHENIDEERWTYRLAGPSDRQLGVEMGHLERVLEARAREMGVEIRRGCGVEGFDAAGDHVTVRAGGEQVQARWLVGCDGGRSTVRKHAGFEFVGTEPELTGYSVIVDLDGPALPLGRHHMPAGMYQQWRPGVFGLADFDGGACHRKEMTVEHVQGVLRRITGTGVTVTTLHLASTWTDRSMQATTYRKGRVLLAGDAAHVHSPLGGQGLNLGLGDAMNLGWKLAATIRGDAPAGLLDSYTAERHPVGARILDWTRAQVAAMRPQARALQAVLRDLMQTRDGATYFAERVWAVSTRYDLGESHPLVGRSAPDFELDGARLGELLRDGRGVLLDFTAALPSRWGEHIRYHAGPAKQQLGLTTVLVRPDGVVAYASDAVPDPEAVTRAAARWL